MPIRPDKINLGRSTEEGRWTDIKGAATHKPSEAIPNRKSAKENGSKSETAARIPTKAEAQRTIAMARARTTFQISLCSEDITPGLPLFSFLSHTQKCFSLYEYLCT